MNRKARACTSTTRAARRHWCRARARRRGASCAATAGIAAAARHRGGRHAGGGPSQRPARHRPVPAAHRQRAPRRRSPTRAACAPTACRTSPTPTAADRLPKAERAATRGQQLPVPGGPASLPAPAPEHGGRSSRLDPQCMMAGDCSGPGAAGADEERTSPGACAPTGCRTGPTPPSIPRGALFSTCIAGRLRSVFAAGLGQGQRMLAAACQAAYRAAAAVRRTCPGMRWLVPAVRHRQHGWRPRLMPEPESDTEREGDRDGGATASSRRPAGLRVRVSPESRAVGGAVAAGWPLGIVVVVAAVAVSAWRAGVCSRPPRRVRQQEGAPRRRRLAVTRQDLVGSQTQFNGTLGYAGSYTVLGRARHGDLAAAAGQVIRQGQVLYRVGQGAGGAAVRQRPGLPRPWPRGSTGADVAQLNHDLVALGYVDTCGIVALGWDEFTGPPAGVEKLQEHLGVDQTGELSLGDVVFLPSARGSPACRRASAPRRRAGAARELDGATVTSRWSRPCSPR